MVALELLREAGEVTGSSMWLGLLTPLKLTKETPHMERSVIRRNWEECWVDCMEQNAMIYYTD